MPKALLSQLITYPVIIFRYLDNWIAYVGNELGVQKQNAIYWYVVKQHNELPFTDLNGNFEHRLHNKTPII